MAIVQYEEWIIYVDVENTKAMYAENNKFNSEVHRNYQVLCNHLNDNEWRFFMRFGIDPAKCGTVVCSEEGEKLLFSGFYYVYGRYLKYPNQDVISPEELLASDFKYVFRDDRVQIGRYIFDFQCEQRPIHVIPEDMPDGCITIMFDVQLSKEDLAPYI